MRKSIGGTSVALLVAALILVAYAGNAGAQELRAELEFLRPLMNHTWSGHYMSGGPEAQRLVHEVTWEPILEGQVLKSIKRVEAADFTMETLYYWDPSQSAVRYIGLTNRGQLVRGLVSLDEDVFVLTGEQANRDEVVNYRQTFELLDDSTLEDKFRTLGDDSRNAGHVIHYRDSGDTLEDNRK